MVRNILQLPNKMLENEYFNLIDGGEGSLSFDMKKVPAINQQYAELVREVRIQSTLLESIYPQYESARIQEARETANIKAMRAAIEAH